MTDMRKELAEVVIANSSDPAFEPRNCVCFLRTHHAEIAQNAEAANQVDELRRALCVATSVQKWNIDKMGSSLMVCKDNHEKGDSCEWEKFVPFETLNQYVEAAKRLKALEMAIGEYASAEDGFANVYAARIKARAADIMRGES